MKQLFLILLLLLSFITIDLSAQTLKGLDKQTVNIDGRNKKVTLDTLANFYNPLKTPYGNVAIPDSAVKIKGVEFYNNETVINNKFTSNEIGIPSKEENNIGITVIVSDTLVQYAIATYSNELTVLENEENWKWRILDNEYNTFNGPRLISGFTYSDLVASDKPLRIQFYFTGDSIEYKFKASNRAIVVCAADTCIHYDNEQNGTTGYLKLKVPGGAGEKLVNIFTKASFIGLAGNGDFYKPTFKTKKIYVTGDSYTQGNVNIPLSWTQVISAKYPNVEFYNNSIGGTGYINTFGSFAKAIPTRLDTDFNRFSDVTFDEMWCLAGLNDDDQNLNGFRDSIQKVLNFANSKNLPLYISGSFERGIYNLKNESYIVNDTIFDFVKNNEVGFLGDVSNISFTPTDNHPHQDGHIKIASYIANKQGFNFTNTRIKILSYTPTSSTNITAEAITAEIGTVWLNNNAGSWYLITKISSTKLARVAFAEW